jgi:DNA repair protein RadA/Sms
MSKSKSKSAYVCADCGADYPRWQGQCHACMQWNTISEVRLPQGSSQEARYSGYAGDTSSKIQTLADISLEALTRIPSAFTEFDRVLGGGIVPGSAVLIGGHPGAGKSTLLLQLMCQWASTRQTLYVTGEESLQQVAMRAKRLQLATDKLQVLSETNIERICALAKQTQPDVIVIDSIQVMHIPEIQSAPGSVAQVRESAAALTRFAKQHQISVLMVGHVTKDGVLAGPKVLEHCIDCSLLLEGDQDGRFRLLRSHKNRFGAVNELGVFAMTEIGLKEVSNPSAIFLSQQLTQSPGSLVMPLWEGTRSLLVELQALVDHNQGNHARRVAVGLDQNRLNLLLAVLHRHGGLALSDQDVFVNVVGGVKATEAASDLALLLSIVSSFQNKALARDVIAFGEVGLSGEIRPVPHGQDRILDAMKHGFKRAVVPKGNRPKKPIEGIEVIGVSQLSEALEVITG